MLNDFDPNANDSLSSDCTTEYTQTNRRLESLDWLEEFRQSAIPDRLTEANIRRVEGDEAVEILAETAISKCQRVTSFYTIPAGRIELKYDFARRGGWVTSGCNADGTESGTVAYFKADYPRQSQDKGKDIKYETPAGEEATPLQPWVDDQTAQEIYQRFRVIPLEGETFWQVVYRCKLPLVITEGLKKALSVISHGMPAIALRGVCCWHKKKQPTELHLALKHFATKGRKIYVCFDQDAKEITKKLVKGQLFKLGAALQKQGCIVHTLNWDIALGKGIDDVLYGLGAEAQHWFDGLIENALTLKAYRRAESKKASIAQIAQYNRLSYPIERQTTGEYMPELPKLREGAVHVVTATMNSGKTVRIGEDWVQTAIAQGWNVLVISPLNSLGQQTAQKWNLPHIHHFGKSRDQQNALWIQVNQSHGLVCCAESLHRIPDWFWRRPVLLVMDEADQAIQTLAQGDTLGSRHSDIWQKLSAAATHAISTGAIVLAQDGLSDRAVNLIKAISGAETVRTFSHQKQGIPWEVDVYSGQYSGYRKQVVSTVQAGDRILNVTASQREGKRLEYALAKMAPGKEVIRIDSETNEKGAFNAFFDDPDNWLRENQPDVLILSPSAKSGVSIQGGVSAEDAYFDSVWGYFPAQDTDTHMQLLGRYRPSVPRHIFVPPFIQGDGDESLFYPSAIKRRLQNNMREIAGLYGLSQPLDGDRDLTIENAVQEYLCISKAVSGSQKSFAKDSLVQRLEDAGHIVTRVSAGKNAEIADLWERVTEKIWHEDALAIAQSSIDPELHTVKWSGQTLSSGDASLESRTTARKVLWREEFPGVLFDHSHECYEAITKNYGAMLRGVRLHARAENLDAAVELDRAETEDILKAAIKAGHRIPKEHIKARLLRSTGILSLLDGNTYSNTDPRAIEIKAKALRWAREFAYWFRLTINEEQTPVEICGKLIRKLGLETEAVSRPGRRGEQGDRVYRVTGEDNPIYLKLLEALRNRLSESVSNTRNIDNSSYLRVLDTPHHPPLNSGGRAPDLPPLWQIQPGDLVRHVGQKQLRVAMGKILEVEAILPDGGVRISYPSWAVSQTVRASDLELVESAREAA
jgi:hypothetical protein